MQDNTGPIVGSNSDPGAKDFGMRFLASIPISFWLLGAHLEPVRSGVDRPVYPMYSSLRLARGPRVSKVICVRGGILDSVMRENISFVLTLFQPFSRVYFRAKSGRDLKQLKVKLLRAHGECPGTRTDEGRDYLR